MRREHRKVIAGVCSGFAYRLGIDPNVVRIVVIVLAIFGGAGVLLYVLGWLMLTEERTGRSLAERAVRGGAPDGVGSVLLAVFLAIVAVAFALVVVGENWFGLTVLVVALGVGALLLSRTSGAPVGSTSSPASPAPYEAAYPAASGAAQQPASSGPAATERVEAMPSSVPGPAPLGGPLAPRPDAVPTWPDSMPSVTEAAPTRPRSMLGPLTVFSAIAAVGALGVVDAVGATVPVSAYLALALAVVGGGLVIGAWLGRSRGLIALGVVLVMLLVPVAALEQFGLAGTQGNAVDPVVLVATEPSEVDGVVLEYPVVDLRWDMSRVDVAGQSVDARISAGAGTVVVDLPPDATLVLDASVGAGEIEALGETTEGFGASSTRTFEGTESGGTVNLQIEMGLGTVEVNRATA